MQDLSGQKLGPYEIIGEIGHGGMANVYRARQTSIGRDVAIKVLPPFFLQDRTFLERFNREVQVIARLQHPRILPVIDYGEHNGTPYIVMAYMPGGTLADRIRSAGGLPVEEVARLVEQIAEGLDYAHEKGVVHRDFKPSNVLLDEKGNAHLSDFGIAKISADTAQLTGSGVIGTPSYMAPEMSKSGGVTPLVDVYALGVTLFQMLTARQPYEADTPIGVMMAHATEPIPDSREVRHDLPAGVQAVVEKAMAKDPRARYPSAGALAADLRQALSGTLAETAAPAATRPAPARTAAVTQPGMAQPETMGATGIVAPGPVSTQQPAGGQARQKGGFLRGPGLIIGGVVVVALIAGVVILLSQGGHDGTPPTPTSAQSSEINPPTGTANPLLSLPSGGGGGGQIGHIYFVSDRDGNDEIYRINPDGTGLTRLTTDPASDDYPDISADGQHLLFISDRQQKSSDELYVMSPDGSNQAPIRSGQTVYGETPRWSPDGTHVVFSAYDESYQKIVVHLLDLASGAVVTVAGSDHEQWNPSFSPEGQKIVFSETFSDSSAQIFVMNTNGSGKIQLTQNGGNRYPFWSPDGNQILYISDDGNIHLMQVDGSHDAILGEGDWASWSPDGQHIVFTSFRGGNGGQMYIMSASGGDVRQLMQSPAKNIRPVWGK